jgi:hypothetical protein
MSGYAVARGALLCTSLACYVRAEDRSKWSYPPSLLCGMGQFVIGRFGGLLPGL